MTEELHAALAVALEQVGATEDNPAQVRIVVIGPLGTREITKSGVKDVRFAPPQVAETRPSTAITPNPDLTKTGRD